MIYLFIIVLVAAAGITRLWLQQRRERQTLSSVDSFWDGLEKISTPSEVWGELTDEDGVRPEQPVQEIVMERPSVPRRTRRPSGRGSREIDPARRAAAKARLEARRRASRRAV